MDDDDGDTSVVPIPLEGEVVVPCATANTKKVSSIGGERKIQRKSDVDDHNNNINQCHDTSTGSFNNHATTTTTTTIPINTKKSQAIQEELECDYRSILNLMEQFDTEMNTCTRHANTILQDHIKTDMVVLTTLWKEETTNILRDIDCYLKQQQHVSPKETMDNDIDTTTATSTTTNVNADHDRQSDKQHKIN